jgi:hypothetical protein
MRDYIVIEARSVEQLQMDVCAVISEGYRPCGGIAVVMISGHVAKYFQAMERIPIC